MYTELNFSQIRARGWVKRFLENQAKGMTGELGNIGSPFSDPSWDATKKQADEDVEHFIGGLNSQNDAWVPFEQNGYWIDGAVRAGLLADNEKLLRLARGKIWPAIDNVQENGFIGPAFLEGGLTWPHAVYFRALMAEYTATGDQGILEAMKGHFLRRPITDAYAVQDWRIISVRQSAEIEAVLWLYGQTKDPRFLQMAEESYEAFNVIYSDDSTAEPNSEMQDVSLPGMLANRKVQRNHGVTYCEICKLAAVLHMYTGKEIYKKAAVNAFDKVYRDQMLIDGVFSSTEYLNGNEDSWAMHETCVVSDLTWALGYLYMITGDKKYGDWVENAIFNAGLGSVDDDFKGHQYFSCPNQVVANDNCNHARFYRGREWMSFAPKSLLGCCAGNVNRFMPNFAYRSWMRDGDTLSAFTYCPSEISLDMGGDAVRIEEITRYPFENTVLFKIYAQKPVAFTLVLRQPDWAVGTQMTLNGQAFDAKFEKGVCKLSRVYADGDEIVISFADRIQLIENARGVSVKKGPLLYALPVEEDVVLEGLRELGNREFPHYSLYGNSKWNYGLCVDSAEDFACVAGEVGEEPWRADQNGLGIQVKAREVKNWKLQKFKRIQTSMRPRAKCQWEDREAVFTPKVRPLTAEDPLGQERTVMLVPYGTTRLRIGIFPIVHGD